MLLRQTKRCPACKHILIRPEAKTMRFKIKVVASNYLPSIELYRRPPPTAGSRLNAIASGSSGIKRTTRTAIGRSINDATPLADSDPLRPGRTYTYELSFVNPLYEPIQVKLAVARPLPARATTALGFPPSVPYAVNLPSNSFPIAAFAEDWEYAEDLKKQQRNEEADESKKKRAKMLPGVVDSRANQTTVMVEVSVAKDTVGPLQVGFWFTKNQ